MYCNGTAGVRVLTCDATVFAFFWYRYDLCTLLAFVKRQAFIIRYFQNQLMLTHGAGECGVLHTPIVALRIGYWSQTLMTEPVAAYQAIFPLRRLH